MTRPDGEDWLEGRPFTEPSEGSPEVRQMLRSPRWWVILVVACLLTGTAFEAVGAALGDGSFDVRGALNDAVIALLGVSLGTLVAARV